MSGVIVPQNPGGGGSAFAQQGSVDWVSLSKSSLTFSVEVLSRFSKAGVEVITVAMGQALCSQFRVPTEGQRRIADAVSKLKAYSSYGKVLYFGFGVKHIVRSLCETEQGITCAALCACLSVSYSAEFGANVLSELSKSQHAGEDLNPSLSQWYALVDVCGGALVSSNFPDMVNGFCRLGNAKFQQREIFPKPTTAEALASALKDLSDVSQGRLQTATFQGGLDCGWIAAFAKFILCLQVKIIDLEGRCLYLEGTSNYRSEQVILVFDSSQSGNQIQRHDFRLISRTSQLPWNGSFPLHLRYNCWRDIFCPGRSKWSTILQDTFGDTMETLLSPSIVRTFTIYMATLLEDRLDILPPTVQLWLSLCKRSWHERTRVFLAAVGELLPELTPLKENMKENLKSLEGQSLDIENFIYSGDLQKYCGCDICKSASNNQEDVILTGLCLPSVSWAIFQLVCLLSQVHVDDSLQPNSTGLLMLYGVMETKYQHGKKDDHEFESSSEEFRIGKPPKFDVTNAYILFTGRSGIQPSNSSAATSQDGVCVFYVALEDPTYPPGEQLRRRIVPGKIEYRGRLHKEVVDDIHVDDQHDGIETPIPLSVFADLYRPYSLPKLSIRETTESSRLEAWIQLGTVRTSEVQSLYYKACIAFGIAPETPISLSQHTIQIGRTFEDLNRNMLLRGRILDGGRSIPETEVHAGTSAICCTDAGHRVKARSTNGLRDSVNCPEPGEWVLARCMTVNWRKTMELLRSDYVLYYCALSHCKASAHNLWHSDTLVQFSGCLMCLFKALEPTGITLRSARNVSPRIIVHTISDTRRDVEEIFLEQDGSVTYG